MLGLLFATHILLKLAIFPLVADALLAGDEAAYVDGGRALSNLIRDLASLGPIDVAELQRNVVGNGWFMPGMSVTLAPLFVVHPDASETLIRAYLGAVSSLALLLVARYVRRELGDIYCAVLLVFPAMIPTWLLFSYGAWGDLMAGLTILTLVTSLVAIMRRLRAGDSPGWKHGAGLGVAAIGAVYFRSSAILLVAVLLSMVALATLLLLKGRERAHGISFLGSAAVVFAVCLLPWSLFASNTLGDPVLTTTSVPVVLANTFGDAERLCFGPCDPGSTIWFNPLRYSREVARATGRSEVEVQQQMSTYARRGVTPQGYSRDVLMNFARYTLIPARFASSLQSSGANPTAVAASVVATYVMFFAMLGSGLAMLLAIFRGSFDHQVISVILTLGIGALLTQPFVHIAGSRYWTTAAPLFSLAAALFIQVWWERRVDSGTDETRWINSQTASASDWGSHEVTLRRALTLTQIVLTAATALVAAGVLVLAL